MICSICEAKTNVHPEIELLSKKIGVNEFQMMCNDCYIPIRNLAFSVMESRIEQDSRRIYSYDR